tara:strand:- start:423 stop:635 length:213 start_codon:yes stop_codon:yes gene_type:complete
MINGKASLTTGLSDEQRKQLEVIAASLQNGVVLYQQIINSDGTKGNRAIIDYDGVDWDENQSAYDRMVGG